MTTKKRAGKVTIRVKRLPHGAGLPLPAYQTAGAAGMDLLAAIDDDEPVLLKPGERELIPTGLVLELPKGHEAQVRPRSGLALKHGVTVLNSPGTIDEDYRGEVMVMLINLGAAAFVITRGERIAQMIVSPVTRADLLVRVAVSATARGAGGFGSTGTARRRKDGKKSRATKTTARRPATRARKPRGRA
jgi:dUTP pyrophosphatase